MAHIRKYVFDTEFTPDGRVLREASAQPRLTQEDIEAARKRAFEAGQQAAEAEAAREAAAALKQLAAVATSVLSRLDDESRMLRQDAAQLALIAARKIAGAALDKFGVENAAAAVEAAMDTLRQQPRLVVKLAPDAADALRARLEEMCAAHAYAGAVLVRADAARAPGEVAIDWGEGAVAHDPEAVARRIEELIAAALGAGAEEGAAS